jgi:hypothetical protein
MRGLDPRIHAELRLGKALPLGMAKPNVGMGCRIKSGNDEGERAGAPVFGRPGLHSS